MRGTISKCTQMSRGYQQIERVLLLWLSCCKQSLAFIRVNSPSMAPNTRPLLPRHKLGVHQIFFCGIIELPGQKRSGKSTNWNCAEVHSTNSSEISAINASCNAAAAQNSMATIAIGTSSRSYPDRLQTQHSQSRTVDG